MGSIREFTACFLARRKIVPNSSHLRAMDGRSRSRANVAWKRQTTKLPSAGRPSRDPPPSPSLTTQPDSQDDAISDITPLAGLTSDIITDRAPLLGSPLGSDVCTSLAAEDNPLGADTLTESLGAVHAG